MEGVSDSRKRICIDNAARWSKLNWITFGSIAIIGTILLIVFLFIEINGAPLARWILGAIIFGSVMIGFINMGIIMCCTIPSM
jgi:hypothetical protein